MLLWIDHISWSPKVLLLKTALLETTPQQKQNVQLHGLPLPNQGENHWVIASAPLGGSFSQAGSQTPPQTYRIRICIHSKIWERMLYRVFRSSLFFAFSQPEFPQLECGNITKCIQRGKKTWKKTVHRSTGVRGTMGELLKALHCAVFNNVRPGLLLM